MRDSSVEDSSLRLFARRRPAGRQVDLSASASDRRPLIGREISWAEVRGNTLRVTDYAPLDKSARQGRDARADVLLSTYSMMAWAYLQVEHVSGRSPASWSGGRAIFPVRHAHDFRAVDHAMSLANAETEVIVFHAPIKFPWYWVVRSYMPRMIVWVCRIGLWQRLGDEALSPTERLQAFDDVVWKYEPLNDRFQGRWEYL